MAEWINLYNASKISGFSTGWITKLIRRGSVPADQTRRNGNQWEMTISEAERLRQIKEDNTDWTNKEIPEPSDAVHVADPNGEYLGFELTPEEAARLKTVRELHRQYPSCKERYPAMMRMLGDG